MNKVKVKLHGILGEQMKQSEWSFVVQNVGEAIRGIQATCKSFYPALLKNDKKNIKYRVLINGKDFVASDPSKLNTREGLKNSELCINKMSNLKTLDIIPVIEGSDDWFDWLMIIVGIALIAVGGWAIAGGAAWASTSGMMIIAGIGLVAAGVANLLTPDPEFDDFREIEGGGRPPYIFSGPQNVVKEGGPVFVGYGRLLVGSQVVQTTIDYFDEDAGVDKNKDSEGNVIWGERKYGLKYNIPGMGTKISNRMDPGE